MCYGVAEKTKRKKPDHDNLKIEIDKAEHTVNSVRNIRMSLIEIYIFRVIPRDRRIVFSGHKTKSYAS